MVFYVPIISLLSSVILLSSCGNACNLLPGSPEGSCLELQATPYITSTSSQFGNFIEGTSVNARGDIFAVNYGNPTPQNQLGQVYPSQGLFYTDEVLSSLLNGIRFLSSSRAYVVDAVNHRVLQLDVNTSENASVVTGSTVFCSDQQMLQPNDLTLSIRAGTVITSGMRWIADTDDTHGDIWVCLPDGRVNRVEVMGRTNGIDLSPDENTLYVSESYNQGGVPNVQKIWKYNINVNEGTISGKTLFADFAQVDGSASVDIDGMKTDSQGNLYVTRHGGSQVVIFSPAGAVIGKIALNFPNPTNLEFGGPTGTSLFIVGKCGDSESKGCVDKIEVANPGRTWSLLQN
ncbi:unnamed protein product [Orchesella dallaii]|uniref:SMP-30/Gluconolactonase/LRE-like region domain-containing protein n=1 Tax=Orchesella dallaii TaxID=48710 RepID=A0ABP1R630_9HEXA